MDATTRRISLSTPQRVMTRPEVLPIYGRIACQPIFANASRRCTYQEDNRNVQRERDESVQQEDKVSNLLNVGPGHVGHLDEQADDSVHDSASRREVVKRDERVHLELGGREKLLDHDQTSGLESNTSKLEEESNHDELDLAVGGDDHTQNDEGDVAQGLEVEWGDAHDPGSKEHSNRCGGLEESVRLCKY